MPPPANDSQGLKIAVAVFVTLTVLLAVSTYFAYDSYSKAEAQRADASKKASDAQTATQNALREMGELKQLYGYAKIEEFPQVKEAITKDRTQLEGQMTALQGKLGEMIEQYRAAGGDQQKVEELKQAADQIIAQFMSEPNKTAQSMLSRMMELTDNMALLTTAMSLDNEALRTQLNTVNQANQQQLQVELDAKEAAEQDLNSEISKHEQQRQDLIARNDQLTTLNQQQATEIQKLRTQVGQITDELERVRGDLTAQVRSWREQVEKSETVLDQADGYVTYVDYARGEIYVDVNRRQGAREQMHFAIFDRDAPGLPTDTPKATVELIRVGDQNSIGRILSTANAINPIRVGDQIYSPAWSPNRPQQFALLGKIDINRDGRDDRDDLKRMIQNAGGTVSYDLPPPSVGQEQGQLTGSAAWYVLDEREPLRISTTGEERAGGIEDAAFLQKKTDAIRRARAEGVRPIMLERLLNYLGYTYNMAQPGQVEAINPDAVNSLLRPRGLTAPAPGAGQPDGGAGADDFSREPFQP